MIFYRIWQKHFKICWKFFIYLIGQKYFPISTFLYLNKIWLKKLLIFSWCCLKFCHYNSIKCNFNLIIANFNYFRVAWIFSIYNANSFWIQANSTKTLCFKCIIKNMLILIGKFITMELQYIDWFIYISVELIYVNKYSCDTQLTEHKK